MSTRVLNIAALPQIKTAGGPSPDLSGAPIIALQDAQLPSFSGGQPGLPLLVGDQLQVTAFANTDNAAITVNGRYVNASGQAAFFTQTWNTGPAYAPNQFTMDLPAGLLQCVTLTWEPNEFGLVWCYGTAGVIASGSSSKQPYLLLVGDYLTPLGTASWPGRGVINPQAGAGFSYTVAAEQPAAGDGWTIRVPPGVRWTIHWVSNTLICSGSGDPRTLNLTVGTFNGGWVSNLPVQAAAGTNVVAQWDDFGQDFQNDAVVFRGPLPKPFYLLGCDQLRATNDTLQPDDQYLAAAIGITEHYYQPQQTVCD